MKPAISVIICTHNPRLDYLDRVLQALYRQTLSPQDWELLLIDNASAMPLDAQVDLSWHPQAQYIFEAELGLTPSRLRGIRIAKANILVFVDDDNVLDENYLDRVLAISKDWPILGAWGGQIMPQFDQPPPAWTRAQWPRLAIREFDRDRWGSIPRIDFCPWGAGLCVRQPVAQAYLHLVMSDPRRLSLERKGQQLFGGGDMDLAYTACDLGFGIGLFVALKVIHLIPPSRLDEAYLLRLTAGNSYSGLLLDHIRQGTPPIQKSWQRRILEFYRFVQMPARDRRFHHAHKQGEVLATQQIRTWMSHVPRPPLPLPQLAAGRITP